MSNPPAKALNASPDALDTSPEARAHQIEAWRKLGPAGRLEIALEMSETMMELALDGLQARHPDEPRSRLRSLLGARRPSPGRIHGRGSAP